MTKQYLGDSVYIEHDEQMGRFILYTDNEEEGVSDLIYLEPEVYEALVRFVEHIKSEAAKVVKEDVISCICCGVMETEVRKYPLSKVKLVSEVPTKTNAQVQSLPPQQCDSKTNSIQEQIHCLRDCLLSLENSLQAVAESFLSDSPSLTRIRRSSLSLLIDILRHGQHTLEKMDDLTAEKKDHTRILGQGHQEERQEQSCLEQFHRGELEAMKATAEKKQESATPEPPQAYGGMPYPRKIY